MKKIKSLCCRCYLSLLRFRLEYAAGVVWRGSRAYQATLSHALWKLSQWECEYQALLRRHLAASREE